jgi:peptide/nickel transport system substrate-binding protein
VARGAALAAASAVSLLLVSGAGGAATQQTPKRGGEVVVGIGREMVCLNPVDARCGSPGFLAKVLEPAFSLTADSTRRPRLVTSATYAKRPPFIVTFRIHPDARWSDLVPVTARDFEFTHRAIVEHLPPESQDVHRLVRSVRAVGAKTVRVALRSRTAEWRSLFSRVMPRHALRGQNLEEIWSDGIDNPRTGAPIGNGPFLLRSWERGKQIVLVRNPRYWGPHTAYLDRIVLRFCRACPALPTPAEVVAGLRQGDIDMAGTREPAITSELRGIPGVEVRALRLYGIDQLTLNKGPGGHSALKNKLVRRALAYGIDREAIARTLFGELARNYPATDNAILPKTNRHYRPNWDLYGYRPARARRLLVQAGCRPGADRIHMCGGERLSLRFVGLSGLAFRRRTVELIQRHLLQVGVAVELTFVPISNLGQIVASDAFDAVEFAWFPSYAVGASVYGCGGIDNFSGYCQRLVTADLNQVDRIFDEEQRARVLNRVDRQLARDVPAIPLYQPPAVLAFRATIRNVAPGVHELANAENWWLAR